MGEDLQRLGDVLVGERLLLTTGEAARLLSVGRTTIYALMKANVMHPVHIGRSCRLSIAELERYVRHLQSPQRVALRSPARKRPPTDQGGLFDLDSVQVDNPEAVDSAPSTSYPTARLDVVDEQR